MKELSIRNQLAGKVKTKAGTLASVITTRSVRDMKLKEGDRVLVMVKATEASIQKARG